MDEVVIPINGRKYWLWRAIDANGDVLDVLVQPQRNAKAARRFFARLIARFCEPRIVITDKLRSYFMPIFDLAPRTDHRAHKGLNNRMQGSHRPTRKREKLMGRFKSPRQGRNVFLQPMFRSTPSFAHAASKSPPFDTATPGPMLSTSGEAMLPK